MPNARKIGDFDPPKIKRGKKLDRIDERCLEIRDFNDRYGTDYSYGQFGAMVRLGKIEWRDGEWLPVTTTRNGSRNGNTTAKSRTKQRQSRKRKGE